MVALLETKIWHIILLLLSYERGLRNTRMILFTVIIDEIPQNVGDIIAISI